MAHEQPHETARAAGVDAEGLHLRWHRFPMALLQYLQRGYHAAGPIEIGTAPIGAKLPPPRIPTDDHAGQNSEEALRHHRGQKEPDPGLFPVVLEQHTVDETTNDTRQKYDECI